jgi:integrase/recombinase XerD
MGSRIKDKAISSQGQLARQRSKHKPQKNKRTEEKRLQDLINPNKNPKTQDLCLAALGLLWLENLKTLNISQATQNNHRCNLYAFIVFVQERGVFFVTEICREILEQWQRHLFHKRIVKKGKTVPLSFHTQYHGIATIRKYFQWLSRRRVILANPASELEFPKLPRKLPRDWLTEDEIEKILIIPNTTDPLGLRDRAAMEILYSTGIRRTELVNLCLGDIRYTEGILTIRQGKGRKDRIVPIGQRALYWLQEWIDKHRPSFAFDHCDRVFVSHTGERVSADYMGKIVRDYIVASGVNKEGSCHLFRHSFATLMLEAGADLRSIQLLLGHANLQTTEIYTHIAIHRLKEIHTRLHPADQVYKGNEQK